MYALLQILLSLLIMIVLLRKHIHISYAVLASTAVLFMLSGLHLNHLIQALYSTAVSWTTWNMVFTLYLVMCLEYLLRTSGILKNFTQAAGNLFHDNRVVLAFMPAFLGLLPSLGGAIFCANGRRSSPKLPNFTRTPKPLSTTGSAMCGSFATPFCHLCCWPHPSPLSPLAKLSAINLYCPLPLF